MPFQMKSATAQPANPTAMSLPEIKTIDCDFLVKGLMAQLSGFCTETTDLVPDAQLMSGEAADLIEGIQAITRELNIPYNPATDSTYKFIVTDKGSAYLAGPSIVQDGEGVGIAWGDTVYPIDTNENLASPKWRLIFDEQRANFIFRPKELKFPVSIRLEDVKKLKDDFVSLFTFGELHPYLKPLGSTINKFQNLEDGTVVEILGLKEIRSSKNGDRQYGILACLLEGKDADFFTPSELSDWQEESYFPITATKQGYELLIVTPGGNGSLALGVPYKKIHELEIGSDYHVTHYSIKTSTYDGRSWDAAVLYVVHPDGSQFQVNGNRQILESLEVQLRATNDGGEKHECNASLILDSVKVKKGNDGKERKYPRFRFKLESPESKRLAALLSKKSA